MNKILALALFMYTYIMGIYSQIEAPNFIKIIGVVFIFLICHLVDSISDISYQLKKITDKGNLVLYNTEIEIEEVEESEWGKDE